MIIFAKEIFCGCALALLLVSADAHAQTPQRTTATYADWTVSCVTPPNSGDKKWCAIVQSAHAEGERSSVGITIGREAKTDAYKIFLQTPTNVWLQNGVSFLADESGLNLAVAFRWCIPTRCLAEANLKDADIGRLRAQKKPGRITYKNASQADVFIPLSFNGFNDALDALQKQY
jgi:invasion protein IalB